MGFFSDLFLGWAVGRQRKDFVKLIEILRGMDSSEISYVVEAIDYEKTMVHVENGIKLTLPFTAIENSQSITAILYRRVKEHEKLHDPIQGTASTIWLYTMRAAARPELRVYGKQMWTELARGMGDNKWFPDGFSPNDHCGAKHVLHIPKPETSPPSDDIIEHFMDDILRVFTKSPDGVALAKAGADAWVDFAWDIFKFKKGVLSDEELCHFILPLIKSAHEKEKHLTGIYLRLFLINSMRRPLIKQSEKYKEIQELCKINDIEIIMYIEEYARTAHSLGIEDNAKIDAMLKIRGVM